MLVLILSIILIFIIVISILFFNIKTSYLKVAKSLDNIDDSMLKALKLIPDIKIISKKYLKYEDDIVKEILLISKSYNKNLQINEKSDIIMSFLYSINSLLEFSKAYEELATNKDFTDFSTKLIHNKNEILRYINEYNSSVIIFNEQIKKFPKNVLCKIFKFSTKELFKLEEKNLFDKENVKIEF